MRSGETVASMARYRRWKLNDDNPDITVAPAAVRSADRHLRAAAKGRRGRLCRINFVTPEIAAMITEAAGNFTTRPAPTPSSTILFQLTFPPAVDNIKWYPPVPADSKGRRRIDRVQAAG